VDERFAFVGTSRFPALCRRAGLVALAFGLAIDVVLFVAWLRGAASPPVSRLALAGLAQSLLMIGGTLTCFGLIGGFAPSGSPVSPAVGGDEADRGSSDRSRPSRNAE
jgi:hypothetical protein